MESWPSSERCSADVVRRAATATAVSRPVPWKTVRRPRPDRSRLARPGHPPGAAPRPLPSFPAAGRAARLDKRQQGCEKPSRPTGVGGSRVRFAGGWARRTQHGFRLEGRRSGPWLPGRAGWAERCRLAVAFDWVEDGRGRSGGRRGEVCRVSSRGRFWGPRLRVGPGPKPPDGCVRSPPKSFDEARVGAGGSTAGRQRHAFPLSGRVWLWQRWV